jgi:hypothetical protein
MELSKEENTICSPSPIRVARRALVLASVVCRGFLENDSKEDWALVVWKKLLPWLERHQLLDEIEPHEMVVLKAPLGTLDRKLMIDAGWRTGGLAVLAWALFRFDLPSYDIQVKSAYDLAASLGFLEDEETEKLLNKPQLRSQSKLFDLSEALLAFHWRLRQYRLHSEPLNLMEIGQRSEWLGTHGIEQLTLIEGDLAILGKPIAKSSTSDISNCTSIAQERHQAINWLRGQELLYSQVTTDT